jgi:hypothetical protein
LTPCVARQTFHKLLCAIALRRYFPSNRFPTPFSEQGNVWARRADPTRKKRTPNAHPASLYLFSRRLVAKQDGEALTGTLSGPKGAKTPYYRHPKGKRGLRAGSIYNNGIRADVLHTAAVKVLAEVLSDVADLRTRLTQFVIDQRNAALQETPDVAALEKERDDVKLQINSIIKSLSGAALHDVQDDLERLRNRRNAIEERLNQIKAGQQIDARPVEEVVAEAMTVIAEQRDQLATLSIEPLHKLVGGHKWSWPSPNAPTSSFVAQPRSRRVMRADERPHDDRCGRTSREFSTGAPTQPGNRLFLPLGEGRCNYARAPRIVCHAIAEGNGARRRNTRPFFIPSDLTFPVNMPIMLVEPLVVLRLPLALPFYGAASPRSDCGRRSSK